MVLTPLHGLFVNAAALDNGPKNYYSMLYKEQY